MAQYKMLDGNAAAVQAVSMAGVKVVSAYPITPQSPIAEKLSNLIAQGTLDAKYIRVESEHSALSCALGSPAHRSQGGYSDSIGGPRAHA